MSILWTVLIHWLTIISVAVSMIIKCVEFVEYKISVYIGVKAIERFQKSKVYFHFKGTGHYWYLLKIIFSIKTYTW